jgi:hypothetical protein
MKLFTALLSKKKCCGMIRNSAEVKSLLHKIPYFASVNTLLAGMVYGVKTLMQAVLLEPTTETTENGFSLFLIVRGIFKASGRFGVAKKKKS